MRPFTKKSHLQRLVDTAADALNSSRPFTKKSHPQRLVDTAADALNSSSGIRLSRPSNPGQALKSAVPKDAAKKAGAVAGGLAALTAASVGISALRHSKEGTRTDS